MPEIGVSQSWWNALDNCWILP